jgi:L-asparaginase
MAQREGRLVVLGTGGTIAGVAKAGHGAGEVVAYDAGALGADRLVAALPGLAGWPIEVRNVAQIDSCDMGVAVWQTLLGHARATLTDPGVAGVVVTHGTDTLEETAYLLHRVLDTEHKPVVLTAAMRPASAASPDGPQNLLDALALARDAQSRGVLVAFGGLAWPGDEVRKLHGQALAAFAGGPGGPAAVVANGVVTHFRRLAAATPRVPESVWGRPAERWPWVEILTSHAAARGDAVRALLAAGVQGLVVAGTGNGSIHVDLRAALREAQARGVPVWRASRCVAGGVVGPWDDDLPLVGLLTPAQARIALTLELMATALP